VHSQNEGCKPHAAHHDPLLKAKMTSDHVVFYWSKRLASETTCLQTFHTPRQQVNRASLPVSTPRTHWRHPKGAKEAYLAAPTLPKLLQLVDHVLQTPPELRLQLAAVDDGCALRCCVFRGAHHEDERPAVARGDSSPWPCKRPDNVKASLKLDTTYLTNCMMPPAGDATWCFVCCCV
jgi:hypothetical protein